MLKKAGDAYVDWRKHSFFSSSKKLSLTELASRCGIMTSYTSSIERGVQSNPSVGILKKIAEEFDIPIDRLINGCSFSPNKELEEEWLTLAREAMHSGISKQQFKEFLALQKQKK